MGRQGILDVLNDIRGISPIIRCGSGSYGEVWLCRDSVERTIALKIVSKTLLGESWEREFQGLKAYCHKIQGHPNLLNIYHIFDAGDYFCYTMEAADDFNRGNGPYMADTLSYRLKRGRMELDDLEILMTGLLNGLETLHCAGLTHRDIKPGNILIVNTYPKIADIGLVTALDRSYSMSLVGTPGFIPWEVLTDKYNGVQHDLFATAKVLYCAMTGNPVDRFPYFPPELLENGVYRKLNTFLLRACSDQIPLRYRSAREFKQDFDRCINNHNERLHSRFYRIGRTTATRHRSFIILLLISVFMFGSGLFFFFLSKNTQGNIPEPKRMQITSAEVTEPATEAKLIPVANPQPADVAAPEAPPPPASSGRIQELEKELAALQQNPVDNTAYRNQVFFLKSKIDFRRRQSAAMARLTEKRQKIQEARHKNYSEAANREFYEMVKEQTTLRRDFGYSPQRDIPACQILLDRLATGQVNPNLNVVDGSMPEFTGPLIIMVVGERLLSPAPFIQALLDLNFDPEPLVRRQMAAGVLSRFPSLADAGWPEKVFTPELLFSALKISAKPGLAERLIEYGVNIHARDKNEKTPLHYAAENNLNDALLMLLRADADPNAMDNSGNTPLILAAMAGNTDGVAALTMVGADLKHINFHGKSVKDYQMQSDFVVAMREGDPGAIKAALAAGANPYLLSPAPNIGGNSYQHSFPKGANALQRAAIAKNYSLVEALLESGVDPNNIPPNTSHPLELAATNDDLKMFQLLLDHKANPDSPAHTVRYNSDNKILHLLCFNRKDYFPFLQAILKTNVDVNIRNNFDITPLHLSVDNQYYGFNPAVMKALIAAGADVNLADKNGNTPLITAIRNRHFEAVQLLVKAGADVNIRTKYSDQNALMIAASVRAPQGIFECLLDAGANPALRSKDGKTFEEMAKDVNTQEAIKQALAKSKNNNK